MNSKQRVLKALKGEKTDRRPNFNILMEFAAHYAGNTMDAFCKDYRVLTDSILKASRDFEIDILSTMSDAYRETYDYGAKVTFPYDKLPFCTEHFINGAEDLKKLKPFKIEDSERMLDRVKAIEVFKKEAKDEMVIMGWCEGMGAEAADLMGLTSLLINFYDEPEMVKEIMDICFETVINCIKPQIDAGADIIGIGDAAASVMGPTLYKEWVLPYEQKIFNEIKRLGAIGRLHICGDIAPLLPDLNTCGADIIDVDWMVDFSKAREILDDKIIINGNFDPVAILLYGSVDDVCSAVKKSISDGGENAFIMAGCEVPTNTPYENLRAVSETIKKYS